MAAERERISHIFANLDQRSNLIHTVDCRSLYASILNRWLGLPSQPLLEEDFEVLPLWT